VANTIQIKRSSTASDTPSASDLSVGELAVNTADAKLFTKHTDGTVKELAGGGGSGISAVVDDTSPQLGGNLDTNDKNIQFGDSSGATVNRLQLGASPTSDLQIWHDGTNSNIVNGTGSLIIADTSGDVKIQGKYGEQSIVANNDGSVELYHDNSKKLETTSTGATITGGLTANVTGDGTEVLRLGTERPWAFLQRSTGATSSLSFRSTVDSKTFDIENEDGGLVARFIANNTTGLVSLYYGGSQRFITTSEGAQINSNLLVTSTDGGATEDPTLDLYRNSASPADGDVLGHIDFSGENSAGEKIVYAQINTDTADVTDGTEDGRMDLAVISNGTQSNRLVLQGNGVTQVSNKDLLLNGVNLLLESSGNRLTVQPSLTADRTITLPDQTGTAMVAVFYDSYVSANQTLSSSYSTIDFDTNRQNSDTAVFSESAGEVTIAKAGVYLLSFQLTIGNSNTSRSEGIMRLQRKPSGGSFSEVAGSTAKTYHRNNAQDGSEGSVSLMYSVTAADVFRVQAKRNSGSGSLFADGNGCRFNIMALKIG